MIDLGRISDPVNRERIAKLHPLNRDSAIEAILEADANLGGKCRVRITYSLRTFAEQDALWRKGRDENGNVIGRTVTNARGGQSYHNYGLALDFCLILPDGKASYDIRRDMDTDEIADWLEVITAFKKRGWAWGGEWKMRDNPHLQLTHGWHWKELLKLYNAKKFDSEGYVIIHAR